MNASWDGEGVRYQSNIDICVAVATDNGLITPIVTDAIGRGIQDISETVRVRVCKRNLFLNDKATRILLTAHLFNILSVLSK